MAIKYAPKSVPQSIGSYIQYKPKAKPKPPNVVPGSIGAGFATTGPYNPNVPAITDEGLFGVGDTATGPAVNPPGMGSPYLPGDPRTDPTINTTLIPPSGHWEDVAGYYTNPGHTERVKSGFHWQTPDYQALIAGDPTYMAQLAGIQANLDTAQRNRIGDVRQAITRFGGVPKGWESGYGDVDAATVAAAQENPYSTLRTLLQARQQGSSSLAARLAARGVLSSGALTAGERNLQNAYEGDQNTATQNLLASLGGLERAWGQAVSGATTERGTALGQAASRVQAANPAYQVDDYIDQWVDPTGWVDPTRRWVAD